MDDIKTDNRTRKAFSEKDLMPVIDEILQSGGRCELTVTGSSMTPTLKHKRDKVVLVSPEKRPIKKGEIALIKRKSGKYILHRIFKVKEEYIILNGDAQMWAEVINKSQVIGIADYIIRNGRRISCNNALYRLYVRLWMSIRPMRETIFKIRGKIKGDGKHE